jgi:hypothetical protein
MSPSKPVRDPFKYDPEIQRLRKEKAAHLAMVRKSLQIIKHEFNAKISSKKNLSNYILHQSLPLPIIEDAYSGNWDDQPVYFTTINYYSSVTVGRVHSAGNDSYIVGIVKLKNKYPHTIIQPETLRIKIENLITRQDVDFSHARIFSFLFYVITKDKHLLKQLMTNKDLDKLNKFLDAEIEINGNQCYFRTSRKPISVAEAKKFVRLGKLLLAIL